MIEIRYSDLSHIAFNEAFGIIEGTKTDGFTARKIRKMKEAIKRARDQIAKDWQDEVVEKFAKRDESGNIKVEPISELNPMGFVLDETKKDEFQKFYETFGERKAQIDRLPLNMVDLKDMRISARDEEILAPILDDADGERAMGLKRLK